MIKIDNIYLGLFLVLIIGLVTGFFLGERYIFLKLQEEKYQEIEEEIMKQMPISPKSNKWK